MFICLFVTFITIYSYNITNVTTPYGTDAVGVAASLYMIMKTHN